MKRFLAMSYACLFVVLAIAQTQPNTYVEILCFHAAATNIIAVTINNFMVLLIRFLVCLYNRHKYMKKYQFKSLLLKKL